MNYRFSLADVGETKMFGHPKDPNLPKVEYNYQVAPLLTEYEPFDVYLVDGRYRVACAAVTFLHAMKTGGNMTRVRVGVHDNNMVPRNYGVLKEIGDIDVKHKKFWVYKLKDKITEKDIRAFWMKHRHNSI